MFHTLLLLFYLFYVRKFLLYCYYYSVMYVPVTPVRAYTALAFVFGFIQINWWWWTLNLILTVSILFAT